MEKVGDQGQQNRTKKHTVVPVPGKFRFMSQKNGITPALSNTLFSLHPEFSLFVYFRSNLPPSMSARGAWWQYYRGLMKEAATPASSSTPFFYFTRFTISIYWRVYRRTEISIWIPYKTPDLSRNHFSCVFLLLKDCTVPV